MEVFPLWSSAPPTPTPRLWKKPQSGCGVRTLEKGKSGRGFYLPFRSWCLEGRRVRAVEPEDPLVSSPQIFMKYGRQRWKLKGRIEVNGKQSWDGEEMVFLPLVVGFISIKVRYQHCCVLSLLLPQLNGLSWRPVPETSARCPSTPPDRYLCYRHITRPTITSERAV